jgi:hypothetical protein
MPALELFCNRRRSEIIRRPCRGTNTNTQGCACQHTTGNATHGTTDGGTRQCPVSAGISASAYTACKSQNGSDHDHLTHHLNSTNGPQAYR